MTLFFLSWYAITGVDTVVLWGFVALSAVGVFVDLYNYRHGTSNLRLDFD